jgi:hypothetical protein
VRGIAQVRRETDPGPRRYAAVAQRRERQQGGGAAGATDRLCPRDPQRETRIPRLVGVEQIRHGGVVVTGVPKKRCMEIIDELEPTGRGSYTGSAGYLSVTGHMDLNILIRTLQRFADRLTFQVGAGIVADSIPHREWLECLSKGEALMKALQS